MKDEGRRTSVTVRRGSVLTRTVRRRIEHGHWRIVNRHSPLGWFGLVVFIPRITTAVTAFNLGLLKQARCSDDSQNEHEKGHGNQDGLTHIALVIALGATIGL